MRSSSVLKSQESLLESLALPYHASHLLAGVADIRMDILAPVLEVVEFYDGKVRQANAQTAKEAMRAVAKDIEVNGLYVAKASHEVEAPR